MARITVFVFAATAMLAAGTMAAREKPVGYQYQSPAGPMVAFIPSFATGYPDILPQRVEIPAHLLASRGDARPPAPGDVAPLPPGPRHRSEAGPEVAFMPSAAETLDTQIGAVPYEPPAATGR